MLGSPTDFHFSAPLTYLSCLRVFRGSSVLGFRIEMGAGPFTLADFIRGGCCVKNPNEMMIFLNLTAGQTGRDKANLATDDDRAWHSYVSSLFTIEQLS